MRAIVVLALALAGAFGLGLVGPGPHPVAPASEAASDTKPMPAVTAKAILAGGCFWCMQSDFEKLPGVVRVVSGYSGGSRPNPTYDTYSAEDKEYPVPHVEVVEVTYDPAALSYAALLDYYFHHVDPTDGDGQFCDRGPSYGPVIYVMDDTERVTAEQARAEVMRRLMQPVAVDIRVATPFWPAEEEHQDFAMKNPFHYAWYRWNCGRDQRIDEVWSKAM